MCGISGVVSSEEMIGDLISSIRNLEYRGYDSCGLAVFTGNKIEVRKNIGTVDEVVSKEQLDLLSGTIGIAHTRWATHGGVTRENSHPHFSTTQAFAIVHNGILSNYQELKSQLMAKGIVFKSLTDSEAFAHLLDETYSETQDVEEAFVRALAQVKGSFAIAMLSIHAPGKLFGAKQDSPLIIGLGKGTNYLGSDINAFLDYTREAVYIDDGEYLILTKNDFLVKNRLTRQLVEKHSKTINWDTQTSKKGSYSHYMLKEIFDQPHTIRQILKIREEEVIQLATMILNARSTYLVGVGTTYYVGLLGQYYFAKLAGCPMSTLSSDEFHEVAVVSPDDLVLAISQSGETYDTKKSLSFAKEKGAKTAAIVNVMGSSISLMVDHVVMQGSGSEICVVSTKAALSQMTLVLRTALEVGRLQGYLSEVNYSNYYDALVLFPEIIQQTLNEQSGFVRNMANSTSHVKNWLFLGCGTYFPVAVESALKMKEVTYVHAEGMPAGFLKHGTLAMIEESVYSLFFVPLPEEVEVHQRTLIAIEEIKARGGKVMGFAFQNDQAALRLLDQCIQLPSVSPVIAPLLELIMAQLLSYYSALDLGRNIDKPRNLAKSVTVG